MKLSEEEKRCLELLKKLAQNGKALVERHELVTELGVDVDMYKELVRKMEEIGAVFGVAQGMGQEYGEFFKIRDYRTLQDLGQENDD